MKTVGVLTAGVMGLSTTFQRLFPSLQSIPLGHNLSLVSFHGVPLCASRMMHNVGLDDPPLVEGCASGGSTDAPKGTRRLLFGVAVVGLETGF